MSLIDALIPGVIGMVMVVWPGLFTKAEGEEYDQAFVGWRRRGMFLVAMAIALLIIGLAKDA